LFERASASLSTNSLKNILCSWLFWEYKPGREKKAKIKMKDFFIILKPVIKKLKR
jgi:hypothetical protein